MSGLIFNAIGDNLGRGATSIADLMFRSIQKDEDREARALERRELQTERLAAAKESREANEALRRDLAGQRGGAGGGGGISEIKEGGLIEETLAGLNGQTVPELRQLRAASRTGDMSGYAQDVAVGRFEDVNGDGERDDPAVSDAVSRRTARLETETRIPAGFEEEFKAKQKSLARLTESFILGKDYDSVAKGRQVQQEVDATSDVLTGKRSASETGQAVAAGQGKDLKGGSDGTVYDKFTGASEATAVGQSKIRENNAQAAKAGRAPAKDELGREERLRYTELVRSSQKEIAEANKAIAAAEKGNKFRQPGDDGYVDTSSLKDSRAEAQRSLNTYRKLLGGDNGTSSEPAAADKPTPPKAAAPAPAGGIPKISTREEFDRLPSGTRFIAPDGKTRIKP